MRIILTFLLCAGAALASGCASVDTAKADIGQGVSKTYAQPYQTVWDAALQSLPDLGIAIVAADKPTQTITGSKSPSAFSWGERVALKVTNEGAQQTRVEVVSKRAVVINVTASDWTEDILRQIDKRLMPGADKTMPSLPGKAMLEYSRYLEKPYPKAFTTADGGRWTSVSGRQNQSKESVAKEAVEACQKLGYKNCRLYAVNNSVVEAE